jgi:single-strand DNA-binding protein
VYNKIILIGNMTRELELKYIPSGALIGKSAIATSHKYKAQDGTQKEEVCFLDFNIFGKGAEILNQWTHKGSKIMLEGRLVLESWTAPDGTARHKHSLRVEEFKFLDTKDKSNDNQNYNQNESQSYSGYQQRQQQQNTQPNRQPKQVEEYMPDIDMEDEIPF